jgi:prephenate dehydrogenase
MTFQVTIIGLDLVGSSIGLALGEFKDKIHRVGHDRNPNKAKGASKRIAFDRIEYNLPTAVVDADLILLCEPLADSLDTLETLAPDLQDGVFLYDIGGVKQPFNQKLLQVVPDIRHALNIHLTVNPKYLTALPLEPQADLFHNGLMFVATSCYTSHEAVNLATDLSGMLGTQMVFTDPIELDGLIASTQHLPAILAGTLINCTSAAPGWRETRKLTDRDYFSSSLPLELPDQERNLAADFIHNRENLIRWIDTEINELNRIREILDAGDQEAAEKWWANAVAARADLVTHRSSGEWDKQNDLQNKIPSFGDRVSHLIGFGKKKPS